MKSTFKIIPMLVFGFAMLFQACEPNEELYEELDANLRPYNKSLEYTLADEDYNRIGGFVETYKAFNDTIEAMDYIPTILGNRFITLSTGSAAIVTYNQFMLHPDWWDSGFGYELKPEDYSMMGVSGNVFTPENPAHFFIPIIFLPTQFPGSQIGAQVNIIYRFREDGDTFNNLDTYERTDAGWTLIDTQKDLPYVGYELIAEDYDNWGGSIANNNAFSDDFPSEKYIPSLLKNKLPYAVEGDEQVVKFRHGNSNVIDKYTFDGLQWIKVSYTKQVEEQYIYGEAGWAFDPAVTFTMERDDYLFLSEIDPIPHPVFADFGYYYGASAHFRNFDLRMAARRLNTDDEGNYLDPELGAIFEAEGTEAAVEESLRRIAEEGIIYLLQHKFPNAQPQDGGIDVHYTVNFQTFGDNAVRRFPQVEYICTEAGTPPQFELIRGPEEVD